jgi:hypothetical protein
MYEELWFRDWSKLEASWFIHMYYDSYIWFHEGIDESFCMGNSCEKRGTFTGLKMGLSV